MVSAIRVAEVSFLDHHLNEWVPRFRFFIFAFKVCELHFFSFRIAQPSMCGVTSPSCHMKVCSQTACMEKSSPPTFVSPPTPVHFALVLVSGLYL